MHLQHYWRNTAEEICLKIGDIKRLRENIPCRRVEANQKVAEGRQKVAERSFSSHLQCALMWKSMLDSIIHVWHWEGWWAALTSNLKAQLISYPGASSLTYVIIFWHWRLKVRALTYYCVCLLSFKNVRALKGFTCCSKKESVFLCKFLCFCGKRSNLHAGQSR